jgi:hypothetical protein
MELNEARTPFSPLRIESSDERHDLCPSLQALASVASLS